MLTPLTFLWQPKMFEFALYCFNFFFTCDEKKIRCEATYGQWQDYKIGKSI